MGKIGGPPKLNEGSDETIHPGVMGGLFTVPKTLPSNPDSRYSVGNYFMVVECAYMPPS
jgi:hypothetical protein